MYAKTLLPELRNAILNCGLDSSVTPAVSLVSLNASPWSKSDEPFGEFFRKRTHIQQKRFDQYHPRTAS